MAIFLKVLTPFVADKTITELGSEHPGGDKGIHDRDVQLLNQCQCESLKKVYFWYCFNIMLWTRLALAKIYFHNCRLKQWGFIDLAYITCFEHYWHFDWSNGVTVTFLWTREIVYTNIFKDWLFCGAFFIFYPDVRFKPSLPLICEVKYTDLQLTVKFAWNKPKKKIAC